MKGKTDYYLRNKQSKFINFVDYEHDVDNYGNLLIHISLTCWYIVAIYNWHINNITSQAIS